MPNEQLPTQHSNAVPPGWQVLPTEPLPHPTYFPAGLAMGVAFLFWGLITIWVVWLVGVVSFIAFSANCTHLGCPVRWLEGADLFMCPCHGGVYYSDGDVAAGPPPLPLFRYDVRVANGEVQMKQAIVPISTTL